MLTWLAIPALAATTAGGVSLTTANVGGIGPVDVGVLPCVGGVGLALDDTTRRGGAGTYCADGDARLVFGGPTFGRTEDVAFGYAGYGAELGGGYVSAVDADGRLRAAFGYARPRVFVGVPVGFGAAELALVGQLPVPFVQAVRGDARPRVAFPSLGVELTVLLGDFAHRKDRAPE